VQKRCVILNAENFKQDMALWDFSYSAIEGHLIPGTAFSCLDILSSGTFYILQLFNPHYILTYNLNVWMKLLNPVLKKLHVNSLAVSEQYFSN
jgi:hypothetical protein